MSVRLRPALAVAVCAALAAGSGIAAAAPKPACNLVVDPKGDASPAAGLASDPALDIVSSDVASNAKKVTAVVRVVKAAKSSSQYPYGISWRMNFTVGENRFFMSAISDRSGIVGQTGYTDETGGHIDGGATVVVDEQKNEIRMSAPTAGFAGRGNLKPGVEFSALNSVTGAIAQIPNVGNLRFPTVDTATSEQTYKGGAASCVKPGK